MQVMIRHRKIYHVLWYIISSDVISLLIQIADVSQTENSGKKAEVPSFQGMEIINFCWMPPTFFGFSSLFFYLFFFMVQVLLWRYQ